MVKVEKRGRVNQIRVVGRVEERNEALKRITSLLQGMKNDEIATVAAATLFKTVR